MKKLMFLVFAVLFVSYAGAQTKTPVKSTDLNKTITDHIAKNYVGYKISNAYKVETNKVVTYEVIIQKDASKNTLIYNDKGVFLKTEANNAVKTVNKTTPVKATSHTTPVNKTTSPSSSTKTTNQSTGAKPK
jgi:hypothetical protein